MQIFISHISEEKSLALVMKSWLESSFPQIKVFVSSDPDDIPAGTKWLNKISDALKESTLLIILYSPQSTLRPWINFEAGCGWIKDIPIMPICHSGLTINQIGAPISSFQGLEIESDDFPKRFFEDIAKQAGLTNAPHLATDEFMGEVKTAMDGIEPSKVMENAPTEEKSEFDEKQIQIMQCLAQCKDAGGTYMKDTDIVDKLTMKLTVLQHHINSLVKKEYVDTLPILGNMHYSISPKGIDYLVGNGLHK